MISRGGKYAGTVLTHRLSWRLHHGIEASDLKVLHRCDNPPCLRPDHLFLGTIADNNADMVAKGRCGVATENRVRGVRHHCARLTGELVLEARRRNADGETGAFLAREMGVSKSSMHAVLTRVTWTHL